MCSASYPSDDNVALPAFTRRMPGPQQQTCTSGFAAVGPCWDGQTERQTDGYRTVT